MAARKPKGYKVTGAVAVIRKDGNERYVYRGVTLPASAFDEDNAKHLLGAGLIEPHDPPAGADEAGDEKDAGEAGDQK